MKYFHKNIKRSEELTYLRRIEKIHPHKMIFYLAMFGSTLIISFLLLSFHFSKPAESNIALNFRFPKIYLFNTLVLLFSVFVISRVKLFYNSDDAGSMRRSLALTMSASFLFMLMQLAGVVQLLGNHLFMASEIIKSYTFFMLTFHFILHSVGVILCSLAFTKYRVVEKDPVIALILFTNPYEKVKIGTIAEYWYFLSIIWLIIYSYMHFSF